MGNTFYNGEMYNDDRLYVLLIAKCTITEVDEETIETIIHHESAPADHLWCIATYRNTNTYPLTRVDHFHTYDQARAYLEKTEPTVPLISLDGNSPTVPLSFASFLDWKSENSFKDYDYRAVYARGGTNAKEMCISRR